MRGLLSLLYFLPFPFTSMSGEPEPAQEPAVDEAGAIELQEIAPEGEEELEGMLTGDSNTEEVPTGWPFLRTNFFPADTLRL
jgi:hypothetical protein